MLSGSVLALIMPCGGYSSFRDCVSKNKDKRDPEAYCAEIMRKVTGKGFLFSSERQGFNCYAVETKAGKEYFVEGYIATYDKDKVNDVISKSAMQDIYDQADVISADIEHEAFKPDENGYGPYHSRSSLIPVAKAVEKKLDEIGVWIKAKVNPHLNKFGEVWGSLQDGFLKAFSIAFAQPSEEDFVLKSDGTRVLNRLKGLLNVAFTGNPVNPNATITSVVAKNMESIFKKEEFMMDDEKTTETETKPTEPVKKTETETKVPEIKVEVKEILDEIKREQAEIKSMLSVKEKPAEKKDESQPITEMKAILAELREMKEQLKQPVMKAVVPAQTNIEEKFSVLNYIR